MPWPGPAKLSVGAHEAVRTRMPAPSTGIGPTGSPSAAVPSKSRKTGGCRARVDAHALCPASRQARSDAVGHALAGQVRAARTSCRRTGAVLRRRPSAAAVGRDVALGRVRPDVARRPPRRLARLARCALDDALGEGRVVAGEQQVVVAERGRVDRRSSTRRRAAGRRVASTRITVRLGVDRDRPARLPRPSARPGCARTARSCGCATRRAAASCATPDARRASSRASAARIASAMPSAVSVEHARVEQVAAEQRVAARVDRPDRAGRRVRVGGREQQPVAVDAGGGDPVQHRLGERRTGGRRGRPARARTCPRAVSSTIARARTRVWMPRLATKVLA